MKIQPLSDNILIKPEKIKEKEGSIFIPVTARKTFAPETGTVIAVGPGRIDKDGAPVKMEVKTNDKVLFLKHGPNEIEVEGVKYLIARVGEILAILS